MKNIIDSKRLYFFSHKDTKPTKVFLMRKFFLLVFLVSLWDISFAQSPLPHYPDSLFSTYYHQRVTHFQTLPKTNNEIIFLGNSITDGGEWSELFKDPHVKNRGISGDITTGVLNRLDNIVKRNPEKIFLLIGINDLARGISPDTVFHNILHIVSLIHEYSPATKVYVQSIFPVNKKPGKFPSHVNKGQQVKYINKELQENTKQFDFTYVDVYDALKNSTDALDLEYTNDGLHLLGAGYMVWKHVVYAYVYDLQQNPSIIPKPQSLEWSKERFPLYLCHNIILENDALKAVAQDLQKLLEKEGIHTDIKTNSLDNTPSIELRLGNVEVSRHGEEAYTLHVTDNKVVITGNTPHGIFNGIQTLRQLMHDGVFIEGCTIKDWPAFSWRGYMVDVGRNFQTMDQLKQQIDVMAHYKLNKFHFHLTENVAWRLQIKRYPQLTDPEFMTRNKGQYYTIDEMHNLIQYCKDRFITLIPEIDMPGHSAAFERAMGVNMQSEKGLQIIKNILTEVDSTYDVPYFHIGADEVKFTNKNFIPKVVDLIHKDGKQTIGWNPGGNYDQQTIQQLWSRGKPDDPHARYIDSRSLYLNHKDPLSGVFSIFYKKIGDVDHGDSSMLGSEICLWNDDRAKDEKDILLMNFAYPAMLAFAERSWQGGGYKGMMAAMGADTSARYKEFVNFENRLLDQKKLFFKYKSFPYVKQTNIHWKLFGPFNNHGDSSAKFWPEIKTNSIVDSIADLQVNGATIWLRHFFTPAISGVLKNPEPNTTWYAFRKIYSPVDTTGYFWISFYNPSRSHAVSTPELGKWDQRGSKLWINGKLVPPPHWTYPGRSGSQENPLVDESYEYRPPTKVHLNKGWNTILVKAPVESFKGDGWQHPVKWMFTVVKIKDKR